MAVLTVSAQDVRKAMTLQDLVGEWELISEESSFPGSKIKATGIIRITVKGTEVTIFRRVEDDHGFSERVFVYFADGSGETNRRIFADGAVIEEKTKTTWKKGILATRGTYKITPSKESKRNAGTAMSLEGRFRLSNDFLKLEHEQMQHRPGPRPIPFGMEFTTWTIYRRL